MWERVGGKVLGDGLEAFGDWLGGVREARERLWEGVVGSFWRWFEKVLGFGKERKKIREEKESKERCRCAKRWESRETLCFSNDFVAAPAGRKVGSLKRRVRSQLAR